MRISDWSSDVCSSDLVTAGASCLRTTERPSGERPSGERESWFERSDVIGVLAQGKEGRTRQQRLAAVKGARFPSALGKGRSEEHTSELQSLMRISYAVFCLKKKTTYTYTPKIPEHTRRV